MSWWTANWFKSRESKISLEISFLPHINNFYYESGTVQHLPKKGVPAPYIMFDGMSVCTTPHSILGGVYPNIMYTGCYVSVAVDIPIVYRPTPVHGSEDVRKAVRAYELHRYFRLGHETRVLSITFGQGLVEASLAKYMKMSAIGVYDFPGYEVPKRSMSFPVEWFSFQNFNLNRDVLRFLRNKEVDYFYFDASITYYVGDYTDIIRISDAVQCSWIIRLSIFTGLKSLCELFSRYDIVDVFQPLSSRAGDYYAKLDGYHPSKLDLVHALRAYTICTASFNFPVKAYTTYLERVRAGKLIDYEVPNTVVRNIEDFKTLSQVWSKGHRLEAAMMVLEFPFFRDILVDLLENVSWYNDPFLNLQKGFFYEKPITKHLNYAVTNHYAYVQVTQAGRHLDPLLMEIGEDLGLHVEHVVPNINNHTMEGSIVLRIDRDLNEDIDYTYYREYIPYFIRAIEYLCKTYEHLFSNVVVQFEDLLEQCNKSSSVGIQARYLAPGASSIAQAIENPEFLAECMSVFLGVNSKEKRVVNLSHIMFGKNHEIVYPSKIYEGEPVPRLLIFHGAQFRIGLSGMFLPVLRKVVEGEFPCQVGKTPMQQSVELNSEWAKCEDPSLLELDLSNWDGGVQLLHQLGFYYILSYWIPKFKQSYTNYFYHEIFKFLILDGRLYYGYAFRSTGGEDTLIGNSFMHLMVVIAMLFFSGLFVQGWLIWFSVVGDDGIFIGERKYIDRIDLAIYEKHGMRLKRFPAKCLEDVRYLGHGYPVTSVGTCTILRPLWELFSRVPYIWTKGDNMAMFVSKLTSYYLLYWHVLEFRIVMLYCIQEKNITALSSDMSERGMGYVASHIDNFHVIIKQFWGSYDPNDFVDGYEAIRNLYEPSKTHKAYPKDRFMLYYDSIRDQRYLPRRDLALKYFDKVRSVRGELSLR